MPPFALSLEAALGVTEAVRRPTSVPPHADLDADHLTDEVVTIAGRVVLKRDIGKLKFYVVRDRSADLQVVASRGRSRRRALRAARRGRPRRHHRRDRSCRHDAQGRTERVRRPLGHAHQGAAAAAREVARPAGPRPAAAPALPAPDRRRRAAARVPRAGRGAEDDAPCARRAGLRRVRGTDAADRGRWRERARRSRRTTTPSTCR